MLIANHIGPILMIAFTNHALDHMLCSVLDANITTDIVRLGSRSSDERISEYSIETREMVAGQSRLDHTHSTKYHELKSVGEEISKLIDRMQKIDLESDSSEIVKYLSLFHPEHHASMHEPPQWIEVSRTLSQDDSESGVKWQKQGRRGQVTAEDTSIYAFWKNCGDLGFLDTVMNPVVVPQASSSYPEPAVPGPSRSNRFELLTEAAADVEDMGALEEAEYDESDEESDEIQPEKSWMKVGFADTPDSETEAEKAKAPTPAPGPSSPSPPVAEAETPYPSYVNDAAGFFAALGEDDIPTVPFGHRTVEALLDEGEVWDMSYHERKILHAFWMEEARTQMQLNQQDEFDRLREKHAAKVQEYSEIKEEVSYARFGGIAGLKVYRSDAIC